MLWLFFLVICWLLLLVVADSYNLKVANSRGQITIRLVFASLGAGLCFLIAFFLLGRPALLTDDLFTHNFNPLSLGPPPRLIPVLFLGLGLVFLLAWRFGYVFFFTSPMLRRRTVIVGAGNSGRALVRDARAVIEDYEFIGFIDGDPALQNTAVEGLTVLGNHRTLVQLIDANRVDDVIVALPNQVDDELFKAITYCHEHNIHINPMSRVYEEVLGRVPVEHLGPNWFLDASESPFPVVQRLLKRLLDIVVGLIGLLVLAVVFPFIALAIYLDSPGPIFYRQERVGKCGKNFGVLKFRSMVPNAEKFGKAQWAEKDDPRITRVGRFMRRVRLDELPQFVNIFKGDMSVVGPRPERPQFVEQLQQDIPFYRSRLSVRPGLTGWAQVKYRYGSSVEDALVKLQYDLYYIKHQSITLDLLIILRTVGVVLAFRGT